MEKTNTQLRLENLEARWAVNPHRGQKYPPRAGTVVWVEGRECIQVPLTMGKFALIDPDDIESVLTHSWSFTYNNSNCKQIFYARRNKVTYPNGIKMQKTVFLHRQIMGFPDSQIDHINGNGLDCRRSNIRLATRSQNAINTKPSSRNTSGFKGVTLDPSGKKWIAHIRINGEQKYIGRFTSKIDAAKAYNELCLEHYGQFAVLNKV